MDGRTFDVSPFLKEPDSISPFQVTALGALYPGGCMKMLLLLKNGVVDTIFADPPFNSPSSTAKAATTTCPKRATSNGAAHGSRNASASCSRADLFSSTTCPSGTCCWEPFCNRSRALNSGTGTAVEMSACLPIPGRLHPSHYSLLYYTKGKPKTFYRIRTPIMESVRRSGVTPRFVLVPAFVVEP